MNGWVVVFLAILALSSLTQTVFLIVLALESRKVAVRVGELQQRVEKDLQALIADVRRDPGKYLRVKVSLF